MKFSYLISFLFVVVPKFAQQVQWKQPAQLGISGISVDIDSHNMLYFAGRIENRNNMAVFNGKDLEFSSEYEKAVVLIKSDTNYNIQWKKLIDGGWVQDIKVDNDDNLVIIGRYLDRIKIDDFERVVPNFSHNDMSNCFIAKISSEGELLWFYDISLNYYLLGMKSLTIDRENNIYTSGIYWGIGDLSFGDKNDPDTVISNINIDATFFAKFDENGEFIWVNCISNRGHVSINSVAVDDQQSLYLTGTVYGEASFDTVTINSFHSDIFIAKYDKNQNVKWIKQIGTKYNDPTEAGNSIVLDNNQEYVYVTGSYLGVVDFGGMIVPAEDKNIFLAKYSVDGDLNWVRNSGNWSGLASTTEEGLEVIVDEDDFVFVAGEFSDTGYFGDTTIVAYGGSAGNSYSDVFVAKYYANGDLSWVTHAGFKYDDEFCSIQKDSYNNIFVVGSAGGDALFGNSQIDTELFYSGFIAKIKDVEEENRFNKLLLLSEDTIHLNSDGIYSDPFQMSSNVVWSVTCDQPWVVVYINEVSTLGITTFTVAAEPNKGLERTAILTFSGEGVPPQIILVKQEGLITSVNDPEVSDFSFFPNPVRDVLNFKGKYSGHSFISIHDLRGRQLVPSQAIKKQLDVSGLVSGIYIVKVTVGDKTFSQKLIKE